LRSRAPTNHGQTQHARSVCSPSTGVDWLCRLPAGWRAQVTIKDRRDRGPSGWRLIHREERTSPPRPYWSGQRSGRCKQILAQISLRRRKSSSALTPDRGHNLHRQIAATRAGHHLTLLMAPIPLRSRIAALVAGKRKFIGAERFSELTYTGSKRSACRNRAVPLSVFPSIWSTRWPELIRRQRGGCAVGFMGALSPRTRNAQRELYPKRRTLIFLVATDAIGMA